MLSVLGGYCELLLSFLNTAATLSVSVRLDVSDGDAVT